MNILTLLSFLKEAESVYEELKASGLIEKIEADAALAEAEFQNPTVQSFVKKMESVLKSSAPVDPPAES